VRERGHEGERVVGRKADRPGGETRGLERPDGLLATRACIEGAAMNVRINLAGLKDEELEASLSRRVESLSAESEVRFKAAREIVETKL